MPSHTCIDPHDPYAQAEVRVAFEAIAGAIKLISAFDASDDDILSDLEDVQLRALESEIRDDYRHDDPSPDDCLDGGPLIDRQPEGQP